MKPKSAPQRPIIIIPARMASTRLPGKPLLDIAGVPMIVHVWRRAVESKLGPVVVACDGDQIANIVREAGGDAVMTDPSHPSGSDRIWQALNIVQERGTEFDAVINVQGDLPTISSLAISAAFGLLADPSVDIGTLGALIETKADAEAQQIVKAVVEVAGEERKGRALYFSRSIVPSGEGPLYHHIGLYAYRRDALARFVKAPPSSLEQREKLEQLRALSLGMHIALALIDEVPLGVDTEADLSMARKILELK